MIFSVVALANAMQSETRQVLYSAGDSVQGCYHTIEPGESFSIDANLNTGDVPTHRYLRIVGETAWCKPWQERGERNFRYVECLIDDCLDNKIRKNDKYSLYFAGTPDPVEHHAYNRLTDEIAGGGEFTLVIPVVRKNALTLRSGGDFGVELQIYLKRDGRDINDVFDTPDQTVFIPVPEGSSTKYTTVRRDIALPADVACVLMRVGGAAFDGECWLEAPRLLKNGKEIWKSPFVRDDERASDLNYWVGINMTNIMWPLWTIDIAGKTIYSGPVFDRCSNISDLVFPIGNGIDANGTLTLTLNKRVHGVSYPYNLRQVELIEETARPFELVNVPKYVTADSHFGVLIETNLPNQKLLVNAEGAAPAVQQLNYPEAGLHVISFKAGSAGRNVSLAVTDGVRVENVATTQVMEKIADNVTLSSGDEVYIAKDPAVYDYFFKWYLRTRIGNRYHFRPSYQWCGVRDISDEFLNRYTSLLTDLNMPYAWQVDGRNLAASRINPPVRALAGPMLRGKQAHENDGGYYYWSQFKYVGLFSDMAARTRPYGGIFAKHRPIYTSHGTYIHYDPQKVTDMADGARYFVNNLRSSKGESTRHTGPSMLFRYFYQAGYNWLGAEQMYGPEEKTMSGLRGASRAYSKTDFGSLHAMQWLRPYRFYETGHAERLFMSLAVAYMHGSSHMNTEEALWTDEMGHDRYSTSGAAHVKAQNEMLDYIETHSRRGDVVARVAVLQGRNDAWQHFGKSSIWSQQGDKWRFNDAMSSFDLLSDTFFPQSATFAGGQPDGWFTTTPYGAVDIVPIEAPIDVLNQYKVVAFLGWNTWNEDDFIKLCDYVNGGGTLVLTAAHANVNLQPDEAPVLPASDAALRLLIGDDYRSLTVRTERVLGAGKVIFFPQPLYPFNSAIRSDYIATLKAEAERAVATEYKAGWIAPDTENKVSWTVWDDGSMRTAYLLNVDWAHPGTAHDASLILDGNRIDITVPSQTIKTVRIAHGMAASLNSNTSDVLAITPTEKGWTVRCQTTGSDILTCFAADNIVTVDVVTAGVHVINIDR